MNLLSIVGSVGKYETNAKGKIVEIGEGVPNDEQKRGRQNGEICRGHYGVRMQRGQRGALYSDEAS